VQVYSLSEKIPIEFGEAEADAPHKDDERKNGAPGKKRKRVTEDDGVVEIDNYSRSSGDGESDSDTEDPYKKLHRMLGLPSKKRLSLDGSPRNMELTPMESEYLSKKESQAEKWVRDQTAPVKKSSIAQRKHDRRLCTCRTGILCEYALLKNSTG
jgi:hypothetical protein